MLTGDAVYPASSKLRRMMNGKKEVHVHEMDQIPSVYIRSSSLNHTNLLQWPVAGYGRQIFEGQLRTALGSTFIIFGILRPFTNLCSLPTDMRGALYLFCTC